MNAETMEHEAIRKVCRLMLEEAARLPGDSQVAGDFERAAERALRTLDGAGPVEAGA